jgi:hypothetical protein
MDASLPKQLRNGSRSGLKNPLELPESPRYNSYQGGGDGRGCRNMYKISQGSNSNQRDWCMMRDAGRYTVRRIGTIPIRSVQCSTRKKYSHSTCIKIKEQRLFYCTYCAYTCTALRTPYSTVLAVQYRGARLPCPGTHNRGRGRGRTAYGVRHCAMYNT